MYDKLRIVLVRTSHPGNIGAVARAMKNMGLADLALVAPKKFPHADATARASGADDVLYHARVFESLDAAVADCTLVAGASSRSRALDWPMLEPREFAQRAAVAAREAHVVESQVHVGGGVRQGAGHLVGFEDLAVLIEPQRIGGGQEDQRDDEDRGRGVHGVEKYSCSS